MNHIKSFSKFNLNEGIMDIFKKDDQNVLEFLSIIRNANPKIIGDRYSKQFTYEWFPNNLPSNFPTRFPTMGRGLKPSVRINCQGLYGKLLGRPVDQLTIEIFYVDSFGKWFFDMVKDGILLNRNKIEIKTSTIKELTEILNRNGDEITGSYNPIYDKLFGV